MLNCPVAFQLRFRTILPSRTYWRGTSTPFMEASTTMWGVQSLSLIHSCIARNR
jgi:hypothetical protein